MSEVPQSVQEAVLAIPEDFVPEPTDVEVRGNDFEASDALDNPLDELARRMMSTGFQATNVGLAIERIQEMLDWRLIDEPPTKWEGPGKPCQVKSRHVVTCFMSRVPCPMSHFPYTVTTPPSPPLTPLPPQRRQTPSTGRRPR